LATPLNDRKNAEVHVLYEEEKGKKPCCVARPTTKSPMLLARAAKLDSLSSKRKLLLLFGLGFTDKN